MQKSELKTIVGTDKTFFQVDIKDLLWLFNRKKYGNLDIYMILTEENYNNLDERHKALMDIVPIAPENAQYYALITGEIKQLPKTTPEEETILDNMSNYIIQAIGEPEANTTQIIEHLLSMFPKSQYPLFSEDVMYTYMGIAIHEHITLENKKVQCRLNENYFSMIDDVVFPVGFSNNYINIPEYNYQALYSMKQHGVNFLPGQCKKNETLEDMIHSQSQSIFKP